MENEVLDPQQAQSRQEGVKGESAPVRAAEKKDSAASTPQATRTDNFLFGIPQLGVTQVARQVPLNEPPPMPANADLKYIGKPTPRYDGAAKVTGAGKYTADIHLPGMLYAYMVGATVPHARVISVDVSAAERSPGVRAVHVIQHVLGNGCNITGSRERRSRPDQSDL